MLSAKNMVKHYGAVHALTEGNLEVSKGEVVALLGANGSGKSTLSKIITGVVSPTQGTLTLDNTPISFTSPNAARKQGITAVYQELSLISDMTVAENIFLGHEKISAGQIAFKQMNHDARELLRHFEGCLSENVQPDTPMIDLSPSEKQIVEILKALSLNPRVLILDEATASLDSQQVDRLFELVKTWKTQGMAIVFVSHRMDEIFRIADKAVVLRNGKTVGQVSIQDTSEKELITLMIGEITTHHNKTPMSNRGDARLRVSQLGTKLLKDIHLDLRAGELLGLGGLQGQGQEELLLALFGARPSTGRIQFLGQDLHLKSPHQAMQYGIGYVPGDRGREGLLMIRSILENLQLPSWKAYGFPIRISGARSDALQTGQHLSLKMASLDAPVSSLSGGNAQKVVIGKWLLRKPKLLLLNDPTKGVDVGSKAEFYNLLELLQNEGTSIIFYSSDDEELLGLCHRVLVLHDGRITSELSADRLNKAELVAASMGIT
jgi:ribose transport system ATP-binding protein